jgi:hypothetical protein
MEINISWGLITCITSLTIAVFFVCVFNKAVYRFLTLGVNWFFLLHLIASAIIVLLFESHISSLISMYEQLWQEGVSVDNVRVTLPLTDNSRIITAISDNFSAIEKSSLAIFALFIPLLIALYINYIKDIFMGLDKINSLKNASPVSQIDEAGYNNLMQRQIQLHKRFAYYSGWLKFLFYSNIIILLLLLFVPAYLQTVENNTFKYVWLSVLRCLNYINIVTFITLLLTYLLLVMPIYRHVYNSNVFFKVK